MWPGLVPSPLSLFDPHRQVGPKPLQSWWSTPERCLFRVWATEAVKADDYGRHGAHRSPLTRRQRCLQAPRGEGLTPQATDCIEAPARPQPSGVVRRPQVGELGQQIAVGPYLILGHLPIGEQSQEGIQIGEVQAGVPIGEPRVGTGVMV